MSFLRKTKINDKWELVLPEHRANRPEWPVWEKERLLYMYETVKHRSEENRGNPIVWDIGAEEGDLTALYSLWGADTVLFEPNELVIPNIHAIWEANKLPYPLAVFPGFASSKTDLKGRSIENLEDYWDKAASGEVIGNHGFKQLSEPGNIPEITIDDFQGSIQLGVDIITMDIEGSEFEAIKGAEKTIKKFKPIIFVSIHPEFMFAQYGQYTGELVGFLYALGYTHEVIAFDHEFHFVFHPQ